MSNGSVIVVGSLSVDFVMRVPRRPHKGETIAGFDFNTFVGGKGNNQALAAARAGAQVSMVGRVGRDQYGDKIAQTLQASNVDIKYLVRDEEVGTGIANIYVDPEGDNSIVIVPQSNGKLSAGDVIAAKTAIETSKVMLLQMEIPDEAIMAAAQLGDALGVLVALNPAPAPLSGKLPDGLLKFVDLIIPNQTEAELLTGIKVVDASSAKQAADFLHSQGAANVIVTLGEDGAFVSDDSDQQVISTFKVKAVDTTAAGDAFCGALAAGLAAGQPLAQSVRFACAAGALACTIPGAEPSLPKQAEIEQLMSGVLS